MPEPMLKYRTRFTSSIKNELMKSLNDLANKTRIPKSRLFDEAVEDLLKKYEKLYQNQKKYAFAVDPNCKRLFPFLKPFHLRDRFCICPLSRAMSKS